jgi:hypothetical protein
MDSFVFSSDSSEMFYSDKCGMFILMNQSNIGRKSNLIPIDLAEVCHYDPDGSGAAIP